MQQPVSSSSLQAEELIGLIDSDDSKKCVAKVTSLSQTVSGTSVYIVAVVTSGIHSQTQPVDSAQPEPI